jgi:hypothetical protein
VRILLVTVSKKMPNGDFTDLGLVVPVPLTWCFHELTESTTRTVTSEEMCDLAILAADSEAVKPMLYHRPNNFRGFVRKNETMRYGLRASARNFESSKLTYFEISWDGMWVTDADDLYRHLRVTQVDL